MKALNLSNFICIFIGLALLSCGRNMDKQEQSFKQELNDLLEWPEDGTYSDEAMRSIFDFIKGNPQTLDYGFEEEIPYMRIASSEDGNVRAYNLERCGFGGNPSLGFDCKTLLQYRSGSKILFKECDDFNGYITCICHIDSAKYYLLEDFQGSIHQGTFESYDLSVYKIENCEIHQVKGAFVNRKNVSDKIELSWDDWGGRIELGCGDEDYVFVYNKYSRDLFVLKGMPLNGAPLKYRQYCWKEQRFECRQYDEPIEFQTEKYFIRIEQQNEDFWTYKCWNGGEKIGTPDLVINYGTKQYWLYDHALISHDEWVTDDESTPLGERYTFLNNGYRYEIYYGWSEGAQLNVLYVYDPNEALIYQGGFTCFLQE